MYDKISKYTNQQITILGFIDRFSTFFHLWEIEKSEEFRDLFRAGYCWHFAKMLQTTFNRGTVCITFPIGHFIWLDTDGSAYDIDGFDITEHYYYVPEEYLGRELDAFKHIPNLYVPDATNEDLLKIAKKYCKDNNIEIDPKLVDELSTSEYLH